MQWIPVNPETMPKPMTEVFLALTDGNYAVGWLEKAQMTFTNIHGEAWWISEVAAWMYPE